ncbi:MAG: hypothetical protein P8I26_07070 [Flavobacteriaceae bacterium]|nr:hypothetical protein [Flavobacteriaceae bacterium]
MKIINGLKSLIINKNELVLSNLHGLYIYDLITESLKKIYNFKYTLRSIISCLSRPLRRLLREDISLAILEDNENILYVKNKKITSLNILSSTINYEIKLPRGSRPLNLLKIESNENFDKGIYFGEYFSNPEKNKVDVFKIENGNLNSVFTFKENTINHIHNLVVDHNNNCIWILTGDFGSGAAIYQATDNFKTVKKIVGGLQKFRSCVAFPTNKGLLYATDSQFEPNNIRILHEQNNNWIDNNINKINGPCIYGTSVSDKFYFSTSVEAINTGNLFSKLVRNKRGPGIIKNQSEIVCVNSEGNISTVYENKKDKLPYILFQFGNILFPNGTNNTNKLVFTPIALKSNDFDTIIMDL